MEKIFLLIIVILLFNCKTKDQIFKQISEEKSKYNRFDDYYSDFRYVNKDLLFTMEFDGDWIIIPAYINFNKFQKKYARFFSSDFAPLIFL